MAERMMSSTPCVVQLLEQFVGGQHGLGVFFGGAFYSGAQVGTRIARRNFQSNWLSHFLLLSIILI